MFLPSNSAETSICSSMSTADSSAGHVCKVPWPSTYLGRLQAVAAELGKMRAPKTVDKVLERFSGVTADQVEATLAALVLFGRVEKKGSDYSLVDQS
jgi:hypothetical protein